MLNTPDLFNALVCILALLIGILIGKKLKEWRDRK